VIDAWSRRVVGWSIADHLRAELVVDALEMARLRRRPSGTTVHSDHGTQYCSWVFGQRLRAAGLMGSMGSVGDALDNAVAESFFASLQCELLDRHHWPTRAGAGPSDVPLDRGVLQPAPPALHPRLPQPHRLRNHRHTRGMITTPNPSVIRGELQGRRTREGHGNPPG
jgi:transposase InsO family protein